MIGQFQLLLLLSLCLKSVHSRALLNDDGDIELAASAASIGIEASSLHAASQSTGFAVPRLVEILRRDADAAIIDGALRYTCRRGGNSSRLTRQAQLLRGAVEGVTTANLTADSEDTQVPLTEAAVFKLHSRPTASRIAFLQFKGCTTEGTAWNTAKNSDTSAATINTPRFQNDGNGNTFTAAELKAIVTIWRGVASDYAIWDIDITTEEPPAAKLERSSNKDTEYGMRVCIGGLPDWPKYEGKGNPDNTPAGLAFVGSFGLVVAPTADPSQIYKDLFVFAGGLTTKATMEAISHELGHTLGLSHDGLATSAGTFEYYSGPDVGLTTEYSVAGGRITLPQYPWAPIMGTGAEAQYTQWNNGNYGNLEPGGTPNNPQDDISIISSYLPLLPDEAGDSDATAVAVCSIGTCTPSAADPKRVQAVVQAVANSGTDKDYFSFVAAAAGPVTIRVDYVPGFSQLESVEVMGLGPTDVTIQYLRNDLRLDVSFSGRVAVQKPSQGLMDTSDTFTATLPAAGTYIFYVMPTTRVSSSPPLNLPTNYGMIGEYTLTVDYPGTRAVPPPTPSPSPPPAQNCKASTNCNPSSFCSGCSCSNTLSGPATCKCAATEGFGRGVYQAKPACLWALAATEGVNWTNPTSLGVFSAKANSLVRLPFAISACPTSDKKIIKTISIQPLPAGSPALAACTKTPPAAKPLTAAAAGELGKPQVCVGRKGYFVFRASLPAGQPAGKCYMLRAVLTDGRALTGTLQVLAK
uniref:Peptidase C-terminal archaeal/bacterial domain-containing protein n=1 Tax=Tetradesmus obliquus TaxID=3088 RepID=A0A383V712_TETOB|eukprot:jgi/Sobl393_1/16094/SZX60519.1